MIDANPARRRKSESSSLECYFLDASVHMDSSEIRTVAFPPNITVGKPSLISKLKHPMGDCLAVL